VNKNNQQSKQNPTSFIVQYPAELLKFLIEQLAGKGRNTIKGALARGQISVNQKAVTIYNHQLKPGDQVAIDWSRTAEASQTVGLRIIHEDNDIIVIYKEAGLLSIAAGKEQDLTAHRQLMEHVRTANPKNRIYVVHRLDRDTSGVMLFAKNELAQQTLQNSWQDAVLERSYIALVERQVKKTEDTIVSWLKESRTLLMYSSPTPNDGQKAITHYRVLQSTRDYSLLEIHLDTGRKNQIRVHMKDIGHSIVGDKKYGSTRNPLGRLGLHAQVLTFIHPTTGEALRFEAPAPSSFLRFFPV
jgi:23S rRNA pseudouridine1911/1915/1917 synthase